MKKIISISLSCLILFSCIKFEYKQKPDKTFKEKLNYRQNRYDSAFSFNGVYSMVLYDNNKALIDSLNTSNYDCFIDPMIFYKNGLVTRFGRLSNIPISKLEQLIRNEKNLILNNGWGIFWVEKDSVYSIQYFIFEGRGQHNNNWHLCYFKGKLVEKNEIKNWHMVPPYPVLSDIESYFKHNQLLLEYLKTPKDFEFREFPEKSLIDSNAVWINKYRKKKK